MADRSAGLGQVRHSAQGRPTDRYRVVGALIVCELGLKAAAALVRWRRAAVMRRRMQLVGDWSGGRWDGRQPR